MRRNNEKVIFLVPHGWPSYSCHADGLARAEMAAMFHNQGNPVLIMSGTRCVVALAVVCMREITVLKIHPVGTSGVLGILFTRLGLWPRAQRICGFLCHL
ncbi:hypothetical protein ACNKHR_25055 [Shigella flexneri]